MEKAAKHAFVGKRAGVHAAVEETPASTEQEVNQAWQSHSIDN